MSIIEEASTSKTDKYIEIGAVRKDEALNIYFQYNGRWPMTVTQRPLIEDHIRSK